MPTTQVGSGRRVGRVLLAAVLVAAGAFVPASGVAGARADADSPCASAVLVWGDHADLPQLPGGVVKVVTGGFHAVALLDDGTVTAWGEESRVAVPDGLDGLVAVSAGVDHNLAITEDGTVVGWGMPKAAKRSRRRGLVARRPWRPATRSAWL